MTKGHLVRRDMTIDAMLSRIHAFAEKVHGRGASAGVIAAAEHDLRVRFPESYRIFLSTFGWGRFRHFTVYGLGDDVPDAHGLVRNALAEYERFLPHIPRHLVPISPDGAGNHFCLDVSAMESQECPVVFWDQEQSSDQVPEQVAASFDEWIARVLNDLESQGYYSRFE